MSLQKQLVHLNMTGGVQTKDDPFIIIPSKLAVAQNVEFDDKSTLKMRGGQVSVSLGSLNALDTLSNARRAFTNNEQLVIEADTGNYRVTDAGVVQSYPIDSSNTNGARVFRRASMQTRREGSILTKNSIPSAGEPLYGNNLDTAVIGNTQFLAWETRDQTTNLSSIRFQIENLETGKVIAGGTLNTLLSKVRVKPRVVVVSNRFVLYFGIFTSGGLQYEIRRIAWNTSGVVTNAEASVVTSSVAGFQIEYSDQYAVLFDVAVSSDGTALGLVYRDVDAASTIRIRALSTVDFSTVSASANVAPSSWPRSLTALVSKNGATYRTHAFFSTASTTIRGISMNQSTGATVAETVLGTGGAGSVARRSAAIQTADAGLISLAWDSLTATQEQSTLRLSTFTDAYGTLSECPAFSPWFIAGRIGSYNSRLYLPMMCSTSDAVYESTYYIIDLTSALRNVGTTSTSQAPFVVARIDYGENPLTLPLWQAHQRVQSLVSLPTGLLFSYPKYETDLVIAGTNNDTAICVSTATLDFTSQLGFSEINKLTVLAGACPLVYDGQSVVEEGFHHAPWIFYSPTATASGTYGPFPAGTVTFCFTLGWQDDRGNWHESAPSNEVSVTFVSAGSLFWWSPTVVLPPTNKRGAVLRIYRTKASSTDTSLYLTRTASGATVSLDPDLENSEQLYTAGGVLPNTPAPACRHVSLFQKRLVLSGCGDGSRVYWSKQSTPGYGVEFSSGDPTHQTQVPASAGRVVATAEMDDRLVVLCESAIGLISGSGPASTGTQGQYSDFSTIVTETGASWNSLRSVTRGPEGVWFKSPFGIRLVSRGGSLARSPDGKQAGAEVDAYLGFTTAVYAVAGPTKQQTRFYLDSGTVLVWDYQWLQWTTFTEFGPIVDAAYAEGRHYHLTSSLLRYTDDGAYTDVSNSGTPLTVFTAVVETPWLSFAGIQGFQRVYRLMILGQELAGGILNFTVNVFKDFNNVAVEAAAIQRDGTGAAQIEHHLANQKCESLKLQISFGMEDPEIDARFRLTDLTLQVGVKSGLFKMPSSKRF